MKSTCIILLAFVTTQAFGGDLPDAPVPRTILEKDGNSQLNRAAPRLLNKKFVIAHAILVGSVIFDTEVTVHGIPYHNCVEARVGLPHPTRGQLYASDLPVAAGITAFDFLLQWHHVRSVPYTGDRVGQYFPETGAIVGAVKKFHAGTTWFTHGCY